MTTLPGPEGPPAEPGPAPEPTPEGEPETQGFQMSGKRAATEIVIVVGVVGGLIALVIYFAASGAERFTGSVPLEVDRTLGEQTAKMMALGQTVCPDESARRYVEAVAAPLVHAMTDHSFELSFTVVENEEVNAFALPGGFVTVNSGLLAAAESGEEVAAVLAHEIQHVVLRHSTRRMLRELGASAVLSALFGGTDLAVGAGMVHDFTSKAYDRAAESEADGHGLALLVRAGIDPRGMATFFERLAATSVTPPALLSTHPDPGDRAAAAARAATGAKGTTSLPSPRGVRCR